MRKLIFATLLITAALSGCKKDKDDRPLNYVKYDGGQFEIGQAYLQRNESESDLTDRYMLVLMSPGININVDVNSDRPGGSGKYLVFDILPPKGEVVEGRTYPSQGIDEFQFDRPGTILDAFIGAIEENDDEGSEIKDFLNGTVSVAKSRNEYTISAQGKDENGKDINAQYKGNVTMMAD